MIRFLSAQVISESFFSDKNTASYRSTGTDWCKKITGSRSGDSFSFQHSVSVQILDSLTFDDHSTAVNLIQFFFQFQIRLHPDIGIQTFYRLPDLNYCRSSLSEAVLLRQMPEYYDVR